MGLDLALARPFVGRELELQPGYGWGWRPSYPWQDGPRDVLPPRSRFRLLELFQWEGEWVGGIGEVVRSSGPPDWSGWSVWFHLRVAGRIDFTESIGHYDLSLRRAPPYSVEDLVEPWDRFDWAGYAMIGAPGWDYETRERRNRYYGSANSVDLVAAIVREEDLERRRALGFDRFDEMWEGVLRWSPPPEPEHMAFETLLEAVLRQLLLPVHPGAFITHEVAVADPALWPNSFRTPDVVVCLDRADVAPKFLVRADLVVEMRSPDDETYEKFPFYAGRGVSEILVVDRAAGRVEVYRLRGSQYVLLGGDARGWIPSELGLEFRWEEGLGTVRVRRPGEVR